jgi:hypothetical protein
MWWGYRKDSAIRIKLRMCRILLGRALLRPGERAGAIMLCVEVFRPSNGYSHPG